MSENKCVCHINGYELKDKKARETIESHSERLTSLEETALKKINSDTAYETVVTRSADGKNYYLTPVTYGVTDGQTGSVVKRFPNGSAQVETLADTNESASPKDIVNRQYVQNKLANAGGGGGTKLYKHTVEVSIDNGVRFTCEAINNNANAISSNNMFPVHSTEALQAEGPPFAFVQLLSMGGSLYAIVYDFEVGCATYGVTALNDTVTEL